MTLVEQTSLEELEAGTPEARTPETSTLGTVPANLQFATGSAQVDLSVSRQTRFQVAAAVPSGDDTQVVVAVLTVNADTDENFTFMATKGLSLQDALRQGDALKYRLAIDSEVASLPHFQVFHQVDENQSDNVISIRIILAEKRNNQGEVERHKARFVAQRLFRRPVFDFDAEATYAPTEDLTVL